MRKKLETLVTEYGAIALVTYFTLFGLVLLGFVLAIRFGVRAESAVAQAGVLGAAYLATKATQPLRILATLALTPVAARLVRARKKTADASDRGLTSD